MIAETIYRCEYCGALIGTMDECRKHEEECKTRVRARNWTLRIGVDNGVNLNFIKSEVYWALGLVVNSVKCEAASGFIRFSADFSVDTSDDDCERALLAAAGERLDECLGKINERLRRLRHVNTDAKKGDDE